MKSTDVHPGHVYLVRPFGTNSGKGLTFAQATAKPTSYRAPYGKRTVNTVTITPVYADVEGLHPYRSLRTINDVEVARLTTDLGHVDDPATLVELRRLAAVETTALQARADAADAHKAQLAATSDMLAQLGISKLSAYQVSLNPSLLSVLRQAAAAGITAEPPAVTFAAQLGKALQADR
jgi:hypothetical protein